MALFLFLTLLVSFFTAPILAIYNLVDNHSGESFFTGWDFFTDADPTHGHVLYQSQVAATAQGLISIHGNTTHNSTTQAFIGVDSTGQAPNGRSSVRIATQKKYQHALVLADIAHQPGGICGVWPSFWMVGANWPEMGEIDIVEGVSTQNANQMTLHTGAGPILDRQATFTGNLLTANCDVKAAGQPENVGCGIADESNITFGANFNAVGGGIYATEWTASFIKIWFFPRNKIPKDIQRGKPTPSERWGTPNSLFQGNFTMDDHFKDLQIVMNTAFCGDWAGQVWSETSECAALAPTCDEYVTKNPKAFEQAFWLVNSVKVFQNNGKIANATTTKTNPSPTPTSRTPTTKTLTVWVTVTKQPQSQTSITQATQTKPLVSTTSESKSMGPPSMIFGMPDSYHGKLRHKHKKRRGGAVLPSRH